MLKRISALLPPLAVGLLVAGAISAQQPSQTTVALQPGHTALTWSGAEPYAIANFEGTPVRKVHRFDAARQKWLSHVIGQDDSTLPELHLLPRVQYLLTSDKAHELTIPNPTAGINPRAALRFPPVPKDPLRFEAYWPNEDSPLEDLVVLRGEDERLSVEAWVAGGEGDVSVWWAIDGRVNHEGLASDDVELRPGGHDDGRLYAVDESGQVVVVGLPRVVRLPALDLPEMAYGVAAHLGYSDPVWIRLWGHFSHDKYTSEMLEAALEMIAHAGIELVRFDLSWQWLESRPGQLHLRGAEGFGLVFESVAAHGLEVMPIIGNGIPLWASGCDTLEYADDFDICNLHAVADLNEVQQWGRTASALFPEIRYWQVGNEPNLSFFWTGMDPWLYTKHLQAISLGIWYENPGAVIVAAGICCTLYETIAPAMNGVEFVEEMYVAGFGQYHDVNAIHYPYGDQPVRFLDRYLEVMRRYDDGEKPLWVTEMGNPWQDDLEFQAALIVEELTWLTQRTEVRAAFIYNFRSDADGTEYSNSGLVLHEYKGGFTPKPAYWAVREFITGKKPPEE